MKKITGTFLPLFVIIIIFSACRHGRSWFGSTETDTLCVNSFKFTKTDSTDGRTVEVNLKADYPSPITGALSANIAAWIRKSIAPEIATPDTMDGQKVVDFIGKSMFDHYKNGEDKESNMECSVTAELVCKRRNYVSYVLTGYEYTGGAHGITVIHGATFSQLDGKQYGWELLKDTAKTGFHKLMKKGVRKYLSSFDASRGEISDEELVEELMIFNSDGNPVTPEQLDHDFPLPSTPPYLTRTGVTFVYAAYEIACYAAGMPTFTISFDDIDDYLSHEAKKLIKKKD